MTIEELLGIDGDIVRQRADWHNTWGATFGGYVAGVLVHAIDRSTPTGQSLATVHVSFVEAMKHGPPARVEVEVHRRGRNASAFVARLEQAGAVVATASAWTTTEIDQASRIETHRPLVDRPGAYATRKMSGDRLEFIDREFDLRPVSPASNVDAETVTLQWMRLRRLSLADGEPLPAAVVAMFADMAGAGAYRAIQLELEGPHVMLATGVSMHLFGVPRGPWILGAFRHQVMMGGRAIGGGELYCQDDGFMASVSQTALVRAMR
jgi:acyl-CoA thioesterase